MYRVQKKRKVWPLLTVLFLCAFAVGMGIGYGSIKMNRRDNLNSVVKQPEHAPASQQPTKEPELAAAITTTVPHETEVPQENAQYFVAEASGEVCVFMIDENGDKRFGYKLPIALNDLREEDRELFKKGIYVDSRQKLLELTEDFSS